MLSRVPDHPALVLFSSNQQGSPTAEEDLTEATRSRAENEQAVNSASLTSTITTSASNEPAQSQEGSTPRIIKPLPKSRNNTAGIKNSRSSKRKIQDGPDSYEVEEIFGHRQDNQARN